MSTDPWSHCFNIIQRNASAILPALVGDDPLLQQLLVLASADGQPVAQLAIIQGVHHLENLPTAEGKALRSLLLIFKVGSDKERVSTP